MFKPTPFVARLLLVVRDVVLAIALTACALSVTFDQCGQVDRDRL